MVSLAAQHGITLLLDPAETGSFRDLLKDNGVDKTRAYGTFLGERYQAGAEHHLDARQRLPARAVEDLRPVRGGAVGGDPEPPIPTKLQTIELNYHVSTSFDDPTWPPLIDLATAYTYYPDL